ncbi:MAG: 2Fe-2S iron-sulfur cluster binding domain-containing protein [Deltaproteobacteria bacterium]|nr:2Fe-2S iron-sulfur cluster binding domain-containing protein [Deltaproteobacteria bacterium]MBW2111359.1 2Fe-2S iron-sulfur cluster binding domain-containing protein [Deltaproteobacteria bacterium]MBW2352901.1 2Fe-2S iron-sulfur cluster binding domain-containing protein [Deltaproteobacteria bacterium]
MMREPAFKEFDGYEAVVADMETSRKYGRQYEAVGDSVGRQVNLLHPARMRLMVSDIIDETPSARTFRLVSRDGYLPPFLAGQYIALFLDLDGIRTSRPYSISSPPNQTGFYEITVRRVENGLVSAYLLDEVKRGDALESSGPAGNFYHNPLFHDRTMACIAGGSGVTPFRSMIREIVECGLDRTVYLFHGSRNLDDLIFHDELRAISDRFENINYMPVIEEPGEGYEGTTGLITGDLVKETLGDISEKTFYLCGPQGLYDFCEPELKDLGVPPRKIRKEVYGAPVSICDYPGWPGEIGKDQVFSVKIAGGPEVEARAGEPLIVALEKGGVATPSLCRSGECSMCRVKVVSGRVFQPAGVPVRKSDRRFGYVHSCVSYPIGDLEIVV